MPEGRHPARRRRRALLITAALVLALLGVYVWRDPIVLGLIRPGLAAALRDRLGLDADWTSLDAHVSADLSRLTLRLREVSLKASHPPAALTEADLDRIDVEFGVGAVLSGQMTPRSVWLEGGRVVLDLRDGSASAPGGWPDVLPVLGSGHLAARVLLPGNRTLQAETVALGVEAAPLAPALQAARLQVGALRLAHGEDVTELGALDAQLGWRGGTITVASAELLPPHAGSVELLPGTVIELAGAAGPRIRGQLRVTDLQLQGVALEDFTAPRADLTLDATLDAPLRAEDLHSWLASTTAELDAQLVRPGTNDSLQLAGRLASGTLEVGHASVSTSGGRAEVLSGRLALGQRWADTQLQLEARADLADLAPTGALVAPLLDRLPAGDAGRTWGGALHGRVSVSGAVADPAFDVDLAGQGVRVAGWQLGDLGLRASSDRRLAKVAALELRSAGGTLSAAGTLDLSTLELSDARGSVSLRGAGGPAGDVLSILLQLALPGADGDLGLDLQAEGPLSAPRLTLQACSPELRVRGVVVRDAWLAAEEADGLLAISTARADVNGTLVEARGELRGWPGAGPWSARADELRLSRAGAVLELLEPVAFGWDGRPHLAPLDFGSPNGSVHAELLDAAAGGDAHVLDARLRRVKLPAVLLPEGVRLDALDLDLHLAWREGQAPLGGLPAWLAAAHEVTAEVEARASGLAIDAAGAHVDELVVRADLAGEPAAPAGHVLVGAEGARAALPEAVAGLLAALRATGEVQTDTLEPGQVVLVGQSGRVSAGEAANPVPPPELRAFGPCSLGARIELGTELRLADLDARDATGWQLEVDGMIGAPLDLQAALLGRTPLPPAAVVRGVATLRAGDLAALRDWLGDVRRLTGALSVDGGVSGTIGAPTLVGRVHLVDGALLLGVGLPALEALSVELELDPHEARIVRFNGESGSAPFQVTGRARLDASADALDLHFKGDDLLVWRGQGVKVRADVDGALTGTAAAPLLSGKITLRDTRITRNINALQLSRAPGENPVRLLPPAFAQGPMSTVRLDIDLDARDPVQLENNIVLGSCVPTLHFGGTGREPAVAGLVEVKPSKVALPGSVVKLGAGTITFNEDEPGRPRVDLSGEARVRSWDVTVGVTGPFDEPLLALSSRPPLPAEDVLLLLLTGQPPAGVRDPSHGSSGPVAVYLGQDLLARWLTESPDPDAGIVNRFDVTYAEDVTTRGSTSVQVSYRLQGEAGAGRALYLEAEKDPYDAVNFGLRWRVRLP